MNPLLCCVAVGALAVTSLLCGCRTPAAYRHEADVAAARIIDDAQTRALGHSEPVTIGAAADTLRRRLLEQQALPYLDGASLSVHDLPRDQPWQAGRHLTPPAADAPSWSGQAPLVLSLADALRVGARNSREYQSEKERVFRAALELDLERDQYRRTFQALASGLLDLDGNSGETALGAESSSSLSISRQLRNGGQLATQLALDLVKLLTQDHASALGIKADATITIPLLRGAGKHIATEHLAQAERNVVYAIYEFERFKQTFAVDLARTYLSVLRQQQQVLDEGENYKRLIASRRRARRLADAGRLPEFQYDQAIQDELRARNRWVQVQQTQLSSLDSMKRALGLPPDAAIDLDPSELARLQPAVDAAAATLAADPEEVPPADAPIELVPPNRVGAGPLELDAEVAVRQAIEQRLDLRIARGRIDDAQRQIMVAADALRPELSLLGSASVGARRSSGSGDSATLDPAKGDYRALLTLDLPFERTAERNAYREQVIALERSVRDFQELEDSVKLQVRDRLRELLEARESRNIQLQAVQLAANRVRSTNLFLQAGRAQIRDLLEAQEALLSAQNALSAAAVNYRIAELELQRDLGQLRVDATGMITEVVAN